MAEEGSHVEERVRTGNEHGRKREGQEIQLTVNGHPVTLCFADKPNPSLAAQIKKSLVNSYVKQHMKILQLQQLPSEAGKEGEKQNAA
jgi:hypothetical protein